MSENGEIYTSGKNFTLLPALTGWANSTSEEEEDIYMDIYCDQVLQKNHHFLDLHHDEV